MKQTAVQWFFNQLESIKDYENLYTRNYMEIDALFNEAKRIEKEQLKLAYHEDRPFLLGYETGEFFEEHYKENYEAQKD